MSAQSKVINKKEVHFEEDSLDDIGSLVNRKSRQIEQEYGDAAVRGNHDQQQNKPSPPETNHLESSKEKQSPSSESLQRTITEKLCELDEEYITLDITSKCIQGYLQRLQEEAEMLKKALSNPTSDAISGTPGNLAHLEKVLMATNSDDDSDESCINREEIQSPKFPVKDNSLPENDSSSDEEIDEDELLQI